MDDPAEEAIERLRAAVAAAVHEPGGGGKPLLAQLGQACVDLLPVDGASMSVMSGTDHRETLHASDDTISVVEALQFTLGEGPCFEALRHRRPVLVTDLAADPATAWPVFAAEIAGYPIGAIFAFPLQAGATTIGAMDLYCHEPGRLTPGQLAFALRVVDLTALTVLEMLHWQTEGERLADLPPDRLVVHQAVGMLIAQHHLPPEHALARLRGFAFATSWSVDAVAADLVSRRLHPDDVIG